MGRAQRVRINDHVKYKTAICKNYQLHGHCNYGTRCQFAHGVGELRSGLSGVERLSSSSTSSSSQSSPLSANSAVYPHQMQPTFSTTSMPAASPRVDAPLAGWFCKVGGKSTGCYLPPLPTGPPRLPVEVDSTPAVSSDALMASMTSPPLPHTPVAVPEFWLPAGII